MLNKIFIKSLINTFCSFFLIYAFWACTSNPAQENADSVKVVEQNSDEVPINSENNLLDLILKTGKGGQRSEALGKALASALAQETLEMVDSASNYKGFTQYFNNSDDEFVDIQYYNNGENVTGLNLDIYLNKPSDVAKLNEDLSQNFIKLYGKPVVVENTKTWQMSNNQQLIVKDVSVKLAPGLQVTFSNKGEDLN